MNKGTRQDTYGQPHLRILRLQRKPELLRQPNRVLLLEPPSDDLYGRRSTPILLRIVVAPVLRIEVRDGHVPRVFDVQQWVGEADGDDDARVV